MGMGATKAEEVAVQPVRSNVQMDSLHFTLKDGELTNEETIELLTELAGVSTRFFERLNAKRNAPVPESV